MVLTDQIYWQMFYFCDWVGMGGVEKSRLKLTSAKVEVGVEAELGNEKKGTLFSGTLTLTTIPSRQCLYIKKINLN